MFVQDLSRTMTREVPSKSECLIRQAPIFPSPRVALFGRLIFSSEICPATFSVEEDEYNADSDSVEMLAAPTQSVMRSDVPEMPLRSTPYIHRSHDQTVFCYSACVARPVDRKERAANPKAKAALDKEWNKLIAQDCWDYSSVREWSDVSAEARRTGAVAHVGRIFDTCVEKLFWLTDLHVVNGVSSFKLLPWACHPGGAPATNMCLFAPGSFPTGLVSRQVGALFPWFLNQPLPPRGGCHEQFWN